MLKVIDLFTGIGNFTLGLEATGHFKTVAFCEKDKFCQKVLNKHWPDVPIIGDIHDVTAKALAERGIGQIEVATAGFPCQPFSRGGKRAGIEDERFLWEELFRVIEDTAPRFFIAENVDALLRQDNGSTFAAILYDLSRLGYDAEWHIISASAIGAPHRRRRLFIIAYPNSTNVQGCIKSNPVRQTSFNGKNPVLGRAPTKRTWDRVPTPVFCRVDDGIAHRTHRLRALGNSVMPQIVEDIGNFIVEGMCDVADAG